MSNSDGIYQEIMFFLGAGASVKGGVPDTFGLVDAFQHKLASQPNNLRALKKILEILKGWKQSQGDRNQRVDIELLLETMERLENRNQDVLLKFGELINLKTRKSENIFTVPYKIIKILAHALKMGVFIRLLKQIKSFIRG